MLSKPDMNVTGRIRTFVASACCALLLLGASAHAGPSLLFDPATGRVITQDRAGEPWYPASLTKLMTAYLVFGALRDGKLKADQQIKVSAKAQSMPASKIGMKVGSTISVDLALQTLLVHSANDMAVVLAEAVSGSSESFTREMNETARRLGMTGTHFVNPSGLFHPGQISTARDMALLVQALLAQYPQHRHYYAQSHVGIGKARLRNRNMLLRQMENADGMKTGFVCASGFNLVATAHQGNRRLVAIVLGADSAKGRANWAQEVLTQGFSRSAGTLKVADIANRRDGKPQDMSAEVCRGRSGIKLTSGRVLKGEGVSLGRYRSRTDAWRVLSARESLIGGDGNVSRGIVRLPDAMGYGVFIWNLDQQAARARCAALATAKAFCEVMTAKQFAEIAAKSPAANPGKKKAPAEKKPAPKKPAPQKPAPQKPAP
jgi:D-alanyl-D-alanine carboxypeptidase